jgi:chromate transporter
VTYLEQFWLFLRGALFSFGGLGSLPFLHQELVEHGKLLSEETFAAALAIGRISPGPNGLYVASLGYFLGGTPGALVATLGVSLPALLALPLFRIFQRLAHLERVQGFVRGVGLALVGLFAVVAVSVVRGTIFSVTDAAIALVTFVLLTFTRADPLLILAAAGVAGWLLYR